MRLLKRILIISSILLILTAAGTVYLNTVFFPVQAKAFLIQKAKIFLKRDVTVGHMIFNPGKGVVLTNVKIAGKDSESDPLLTVSEVSLSVPYPDLFMLWSARVFIPGITLKKADIHLSNTNGTWNFADLIPAKATETTSSKNTSKIKAIINSINIVDGKITFSDGQNTRTIDHLNSILNLDLSQTINFDTEFVIPEDSSAVHVKGKFSLTNKELNAEIKAKNANIPVLLALSKIPLWVDFRECFLKETKLDVNFKNGALTLSGMVNGSVDLTTTETPVPYNIKASIISDRFEFKRKASHFTLTGKLTTSATSINWGEQKLSFATLSGNSIVIERDGPNINITAQAQAANAIVKNPLLDLSATKTSAVFNFKKQKSDYDLKLLTISSNGIKSLYASKVIEGGVRSQNMTVVLKNGVLQVDGKFKTENLRLAAAKRITLLGQPDVELTITQDRNRTTEQWNTSYTATFILNGDMMQGLPKFNEATDLRGKITVNNDGAHTEGLNAIIRNALWKISCDVKNFAEPTVNLTAYTDEINLELLKEFYSKRFKSLETDIQGSANNVVVRFEGPVFSSESPNLTASGTLKDARIISRQIPGDLHTLNGHIEYTPEKIDWSDLDFSYRDEKYKTSGTLSNFSDPVFRTTVENEKLSLAVSATTNDRIINFSSLKGRYYEILFDLNGTLSFRKEQPEIELNGILIDGKLFLNSNFSFENESVTQVTFKVDDLDLVKLKSSIPALKEKSLSGILSATAKWEGPLFAPEQWKGNGTILIKDGKLLEIELLKGVWKTLFSNLLVDDYKHIAFNQADGGFRISSGVISTEDLLLKSNAVDLSMKGKIEFNGHIDFDVVANVRQAPLVNTDAVKAVPSTLISQFAQNVVGFKLTGTLSNPQTKYKILPLKVLKKTGDSVFLGIQGMMEDLLQ